MPEKVNSILLVDDDQDDQMLFSEALAEVDTTVIFYHAHDGVDAIEKLIAGSVPKPDIIFMDMNMPRMNGIACLIELKKHKQLQDIPVLMYSTSRIGSYEQECFENGAVGYIEKPNDFLVLCSKLENILTKSAEALNSGSPIKL